MEAMIKAMAPIFAKLIKSGVYTIDSIPAVYRAATQAELDKDKTAAGVA